MFKEYRIKRLMKRLCAVEYKKGSPWNGYEVYEPVYAQNMILFEPTVVLVKDNKVRLSNYKESFAYLRYIQSLAY